jgi:chromosome segregation ATPase
MSKRLLVLVGLFSVIAATSFAQSLADVARKERARQRDSQSKVVVTANTTTTAAPAAPKLEAPSADTAASGAKPAGPTDNKGRDEKYWRTAFQQARDDAKRAEQRVQLLDLKIKDLNTQMLQLSSFYNREYRMGPELTAAQNELEAAKKDVEQANKKVSDLEDELRRSGGLAGWAR